MTTYKKAVKIGRRYLDEDNLMIKNLQNIIETASQQVFIQYIQTIITILYRLKTLRISLKQKPKDKSSMENNTHYPAQNPSQHLMFLQKKVLEQMQDQHKDKDKDIYTVSWKLNIKPIPSLLQRFPCILYF